MLSIVLAPCSIFVRERYADDRPRPVFLYSYTCEGLVCADNLPRFYSNEPQHLFEVAQRIDSQECLGQTLQAVCLFLLLFFCLPPLQLVSSRLASACQNIFHYMRLT